MAYKLLHNLGRPDTLHLDPPFEECKVNEARSVKEVDEETAAALISIGAVSLCEHCHPFAEAT